jgi:hypothetical protein
VVSHLTELRRVKEVIGEPVYLRLGEELLTVHISDTVVMLAIRTVEIKPYTVGYKVVKQGTKLLTWELTSDHPSIPGFPYWKPSKMVTWDPDFKPYEVGTLGGRSVEEYRARREWEDDCHRPGNGTRLGQRDSADRVFQGYDYTPGSQFYSTQSAPKE